MSEPLPATVVEAFAGLAAHGERLALSCGDERISYRQLDAEADRVAAALAGLGMQRGDVVAFLLPNTPEIVAWYLGCARGGFVAAPLPTRLTGPELVFNVLDCGASALVYAPDRAELIDEQRSGLATINHLLEIDDPRLRRPSAAVTSGPLPAPDDLFCIMYTGGSTGTPKAAMQTHRNWAACIGSVAHEWALTSEDRHLLVLPMSHVSWFTVAAHLSVGATTVMMPRWDPAGALELIARERLTVLNMIPTMLGDLLRTIGDGAPDTGGVRQVTVAGSPMPVEMYRRAIDVFGNVLGAIYGLTETSGPISFLHPEDLVAERLRSGGRAGATCEIAIVGDDGAACPPGSLGEICLRGPQVTPGYLNRPQESADVIVDGWFHSGDVGRLDAEGFLFIVDRKKDMIKSGGYNVYPKEVEDVLYAHPDVVEAAVVGLPDPRWIEAVHAVVVIGPDASSDTTAESLIAFVRERLAGYKAPKTLAIVDRIPRTGINKFDKRALRDAFAPHA